MKFRAQLSDAALLQEVGQRIAGARLDRNLTQAALANLAGVSKRTLERLESGQSTALLSAFLRVCRALGLVERLETFLPEPGPSPIAQARRQRGIRKRASGKRAPPPAGSKWEWADSR
jgi:transcriptional regulator with XRE-family HTH domain